MRLTGRVAVVTGASRGLGRVIALALGEEGADLVLVARRPGSLTKVEAELRSQNARFTSLTADLSQETEVATVASSIFQEFGKADILINNAAVQGPTKPVHEISVASWQEVLAVDLTGPFLCIRAFAPSMMAQKRGSIVNVSSTAAMKGVALRSPYCSAKMGMIGLTKALAQELGPSGVRVNAICPGPMPSTAVEEVVRDRSRQTGLPYDQLLERTLRSPSLVRPIAMNEVASAVVFLASDDSSAITGQVITAAGGA